MLHVATHMPIPLADGAMYVRTRGIVVCYGPEMSRQFFKAYIASEEILMVNMNDGYDVLDQPAGQ